jgi:hypothetical protein
MREPIASQYFTVDVTHAPEREKRDPPFTSSGCSAMNIRERNGAREEEEITPESKEIIAQSHSWKMLKDTQYRIK